MAQLRGDRFPQTSRAGLDFTMTGLIIPPPWTADALCPQIDLDLFFPAKGVSAKSAKAVCAMCPVRQQCLDYALDHESGAAREDKGFRPQGIYGGLAPRERLAIIHERRDGAAA